MMRQMFYQNLQPEIFATQMNGSSRLDVMKMVFATYAEAPGTLYWPVADNGNTSFKLDRLAPANGFAHENAHDALADVEATIFIFKKIRDGAPELFKKLIETGDKNITSSSLKSFLPMEVTLRFGGNVPKTYQGCYCGSNKDNPNSIGFADFELNNPEPLALLIEGHQHLREPSRWCKGSMKQGEGTVSTAPYLRSALQTIRCLIVMFLMILYTTDDT